MSLNPKIVAISPAMCSGSGLSSLQKIFPERVIDVGIAEEQAVAMISGMAKGGLHPVWTVFSTFLQRTYDQIAQDLCVNSNPAVINVLGASIFGMNDFTHICFFDIAMLSHIPNLVYLAPTTYEELVAMQTWAIRQDKLSVAIRVPEGEVYHTSEPVDTDYSALNTFRVGHRGSRVALIAAGNFYQKGDRVRQLLAEQGIDATLINPRYLTGVDEALLDELKKDHTVVALFGGTVDEDRSRLLLEL